MLQNVSLVHRDEAAMRGGWARGLPILQGGLSRCCQRGPLGLARVVIDAGRRADPGAGQRNRIASGTHQLTEQRYLLAKHLRRIQVLVRHDPVATVVASRHIEGCDALRQLPAAGPEAAVHPSRLALERVFVSSHHVKLNRFGRV